MRIIADASLPGLLEAFPAPFELSLYSRQEELRHLLKNQDILLCRSTLQVNECLLRSHSLSCVATASSGCDHIDESYLQQQGIKLIDAKGSNARSVADYVVASLAYLEEYTDFSGKKAGIIGLGQVGSRVAQRLEAAGMEVICFDPPKALLEPDFVSCALDDLFQCDLIAIHANLHEDLPFPSKYLLDESFLNRLQPNTAIINASRGGLVCEKALIELKKPLFYCTDVYLNEPFIDKNIVQQAILCTPHIAGHSLEAKFAAVAQVSEQLHHLYKLPYTSTQKSTSHLSSSIQNQTSWQESVLSLYNPIIDSRILKSSANLDLAFLTQRKAHQNRHDFNCYHINSGNKQLEKMLGF